MATAKHPVSFRLTEEAVAILGRLEARMGVGRSAVLETLLRDADRATASAPKSAAKKIPRKSPKGA